jgi:CRP-like cAMP-binding protein
MNIQMLSQSMLFRGISPAELDTLLGQVIFQVKKYSKEQVIAYSGDECKSLQIVLSGSVKGEMVDFSGRKVKIEDIEPPRPLAVAFLFGQNNICPVNIVANEVSEILVIPKASVLKMMQLCMPFLQNMMNAISNRAQFLSEKIRFLSFNTLKEKMVHYLLQLSRGLEGEFVLPKSQEELANMFGATRPSIGRTMRELHNDGYIIAKGKSVTINDRNGLMDVLNGR